MKKESDLMINIIYISIFLMVVLLAVVMIIQGLNSGNTQSGITLSEIVINESFYNITGVSQTLYANGVYNAQCSISSITDLLGNTIPSSNYTVNNCQVTYNP